MVQRFLMARGLPRDEAKMVAKLTTFKGRLAQGDFTAPIIFNLMMKAILEEINEILPPGYIATHFSDDIFISSRNEPEIPESVKNLVLGVLKRRNLPINPKKTRNFTNGILELPGVKIENGGTTLLDHHRQKILDLLSGEILATSNQIAGALRQAKDVCQGCLPKEILLACGRAS